MPLGPPSSRVFDLFQLGQPLILIQRTAFCQLGRTFSCIAKLCVLDLGYEPSLPVSTDAVPTFKVFRIPSKVLSFSFFPQNHTPAAGATSAFDSYCCRDDSFHVRCCWGLPARHAVRFFPLYTGYFSVLPVQTVDCFLFTCWGPISPFRFHSTSFCPPHFSLPYFTVYFFSRHSPGAPSLFSLFLPS